MRSYVDARPVPPEGLPVPSFAHLRPTLLVVVAVATLTACSQADDAEPLSTTLRPGDGSSAAGEVVLTQTLTGSRLEFDATGLDGERWYVAEIRDGSCEAPGNVVREFERAAADPAGAIAFGVDFDDPPFSEVAGGAVIALGAEDGNGALALCGELAASS